MKKKAKVITDPLKRKAVQNRFQPFLKPQKKGNCKEIFLVDSRWASQRQLLRSWNFLRLLNKMTLFSLFQLNLLHLILISLSAHFFLQPEAEKMQFYWRAETIFFFVAKPWSFHWVKKRCTQRNKGCAMNCEKAIRSWENLNWNFVCVLATVSFRR